MRLIWKYLRDYKKTLVGALALAAVNQFFSLLDPQIFRLLIDNYATKALVLSRDVFLRGVVLLLLAYVVTALISRIAKNFQDYFFNVVFLLLLGILLVVVYAVYVNWLVGIAYFLMMPILAVTILIISRRIKRSQSEIVRE